MTDQPAQGREAEIVRILDGYESLMQQLVGAHLPEFMEVAVTMSQAKVLYTVLVAGSLRLSELAGRLGVSLSTTSSQVDRLVELGLLDRHDDPADRRQVVISVTPDGATQLERFRELNSEQLHALLDHVADDDLRVVADGLRILSDAAAGSADPVAIDPASHPGSSHS
ncbi:MAG TPA: MarR family transcriptional regulator [Candidatus Limnocylindrales bacterium]|nr:MarR family transcriptional regulator [Candidatus Limnocylindrales bacterium]